MDGFLCFVEKLINSIIDFFWSLLGLEAIKESPHIKLCNKSKAEDESSIIKNEKDQNLEQFIYEVKLPDGSKKEFLNRDELDKFIEDNKDLNYDFNF
jgi:hypothetical protein